MLAKTINALLFISLPSGGEWMLMFIFLGLFMMPLIFYLKTVQATLDVVGKENATLQPTKVWLLLIPFFGLAWHFIIVINLVKSIKAASGAKGVAVKNLTTFYNLGIAMCVLNCLFFVPFLNIFASFASIVCFIIFWIKVAEYKTIFDDVLKITTNNQ